MTVKELKEKLDEMPDDAEVIVVDSVLFGNQITKIKYRGVHVTKTVLCRFARINNSNLL